MSHSNRLTLSELIKYKKQTYTKTEHIQTDKYVMLRKIEALAMPSEILELQDKLRHRCYGDMPYL